MSKLQSFTWDTANCGNHHVNINTDPSQGVHQVEGKVVGELILERYDGAEVLDAPPKELLLTQTESYVEY
ncbi:hypothetical protein HK405_006129 [Cladochytrium tenue]|nr:hypothetical protein HK405_006129 [Cladochytrium tenue]